MTDEQYGPCLTILIDLVKNGHPELADRVGIIRDNLEEPEREITAQICLEAIWSVL